MAYTEKLPFNVAKMVEKIFDDINHHSSLSENYQLVILVNANQQEYISSCFEKYSRHGKFQKPIEEIKDFLQEKLKNKIQENSASNIDREKTTARVVISKRSGVGKSLHIQRLCEKFRKDFQDKNIQHHTTTIRLVESSPSIDNIINLLYNQSPVVKVNAPHVVHIDVTPAVKVNLETFLFALLILKQIQNSRGILWLNHPSHLYIIEITDQGQLEEHNLLNMLSTTLCVPPEEILRNTQKSLDFVHMDTLLFHSDVYQRPYQYLKQYSQNKNIDRFIYKTAEGTKKDCIEVLLRHFPFENPSWAQLFYFSSFLNTQLKDCENSIFCKPEYMDTESGLAGLKQLVINSVMHMAKDFTTPSLKISDESKSDYKTSQNNILQNHQLRSSWEQNPHPYVFFNKDRTTMTFLNFIVDIKTGNVSDSNKKVIFKMNKALAYNLKHHYKVDLNMRLDDKKREEKLEILERIIGPREHFDPDVTYELTADNILKILAIYMRFRSQIPVILIGETGCGKTRMMEYVCRLLKQGKSKNKTSIQTLFPLKVHGGIKATHVHEAVLKSVDYCEKNKQYLRENMQYSIMFFDEANTTDAIYAIKETVCDKTIDGVAWNSVYLQVVAACNPYKKLSDTAIKNLTDAGLGYRLKEDESEKLGNIPMRKLVYRVVALPPSMQPLVWDFGQLNIESEKKYIAQMSEKLQNIYNFSDTHKHFISEIISCTQQFMKQCKDECHYVSMRDIERCMDIFGWFYNLYDSLEQEIIKHSNQRPNIPKVYRCALHAIKVCYYGSLQNRKAFKEMLRKFFLQHKIRLETTQITNELSMFQDMFIKTIKPEKNIAFNEALKENLFMMTVCIDNRIPLFLVGKPGSSKSLAKTMIDYNMQGQYSYSEIYKKLKTSHIMSFQCSALTDASGIENMFKQCNSLQKNQDRDTYASVVVLDEIGLAEDSPKMPLKVLHPLLETGTLEESMLSDKETHKKVAFVGISNWALDPAKMNRGIFVTRMKPDKDELLKTAKGIFEQNTDLYTLNERVITILTDCYLKLYEGQDVEYFGLRDYYSLIKMVYSSISQSTKSIQYVNLVKAIYRNFSGGRNVEVANFVSWLTDILRRERHFDYEKLNISSSFFKVRDLIQENLQNQDERYLLLLSNKYSAAYLIEKLLKKSCDYEIIFGSSFPGDHTYSEIYCNISRIKVCMETGKMAILLNLRNLYESLYDALNQHFVSFANQRYVDIGLGGHRMKCRISDNFKVIIIEDQTVVYNKFPIPLINRLEKYFVDSNSLLESDHTNIVERLNSWMESSFRLSLFEEFSLTDVFLGCTNDSVNMAIIKFNSERECQSALLQSATTDAIFRSENSFLQQQYLFEQSHETLVKFLEHNFKKKSFKLTKFEVKSFSSMLNEEDRKRIEDDVTKSRNSVMLLTLQQFNTNSEFIGKINEFIKRCTTEGKRFILLIQCPSVEKCGTLYETSKYTVRNCTTNIDWNATTFKDKKIIIVFLAITSRLSRQDNTMISQFDLDCLSAYVDQLKPTSTVPNIIFYHNESLKNVLNKLENKMRYKLLNESVAGAVEKISDSNASSERSKQRLKIVANSLNVNEFMEILFYRIVDIAHQRCECNSKLKSVWANTVANSQRALHEGGTFSKSVWLRLKSEIELILAYILSETDIYNNLNFLDSSKSWIKQVWLLCLSNKNIQVFEWNSVLERKFHFNIAFDGNGINFPFSYLILKLVEERLMFHKEKNTLDKVSAVLSSLNSINLTSVLQTAIDHSNEEGLIFYAHDLVNLRYIPQSTEIEGEHDFVVKVLLYMVQNHKNENKPLVSDFVLLSAIFGDLLKELTKLSSIFKISLGIFKQISADLDKKQFQKKQFILLHIGLEKLIINLYDEGNLLNDANSCLKWLKTVKEAKLLISNIDAALTKKWITIQFIYSFLYSLIPNFQIGDVLLSIVGSQARLLWFGCHTCDMRSNEFLQILLSVLKVCYEEFQLRLLVGNEGTICRACKHRIEKPVRIACNHTSCERCYLGNKNICPICQDSEKNAIEPCTLSVTNQSLIQNFIDNTTVLFLRFLNDHFFSYPDEEIGSVEFSNKLFHCIVSYLGNNPQNELELDLSSLDLNNNALSIMFPMLLRNSENNEVNQYILDTQNINFLLSMIHGFEWLQLKKNWKKDLSSVLSLFQTAIKYCFDNTENGLNIRSLQEIAVLRYTTYAVVQSLPLSDLANEECGNKLIQPFIACLNKYRTSTGIETILNYFVKLGCKQYGYQWFQKVQRNKTFSPIIPQHLKDEDVDFMDEIDYFTILGDEYIKAKSVLYESDEVKLIDEKITENLPHNLMLKILASVGWCFDYNSKSFNVNKVNIINQQLGKIRNSNYKIFFLNVLQIEEKILQNQDLYENKNLKKILTLVYFLFNTSTGSALQYFKNIIDQPELIKTIFLPTMPISQYFRAMDYEKLIAEGRLQAYLCPNNHIYLIGECGLPWKRGKCVECSAPIGGTLHAADEGNRKIDVTLDSQAGYILHEKRVAMEPAEERMKPESIALLRILLHAAMFFSTLENDIKLKSILNFQNNNEMQRFLISALSDNLNTLQNVVPNSDECVILIYKFLSLLHIRKCDSPYNWSNIDQREKWEQHFCRIHVKPHFKNLELTLQDGKDALQKANKCCNVKLYKLVQENEHDLNEKTISWYSKGLWNYRHMPNILHFQRYINAHDNPNFTLRVIMDWPQLHFLKKLQKIVRFQRKLIKKHDMQVDVKEADSKSFETYLKNSGNKDESDVKTYIALWNKVVKSRENLIPSKYKSITIKSPISLAMPSNVGIGRYARIFIEHLIHINNNFIDQCYAIINSSAEIGKVEMENLSQADVAYIDINKHIFEKIRYYTIYNVLKTASGNRHDIRYNLEGLERDVREEYVLCKKKINIESLKLITYPQDIGLGSNLEKVRQNISPQIPLNVKMCEELDKIISLSRLPEICETVRTVACSITYLAKIGDDRKRSFCDYLEQDLLFDRQKFELVPKSVKLEHTLALYLRLSWHRAVNLASFNRNPYEDIIEMDQQETLDSRLLSLLTEKLKQMKIETFLLNLNEAIITVTASALPMECQWKLRDVLENLDTFGNELDPDGKWFKKLPDQILFKHICDVFIQTVLFWNERTNI